MAGTGMMPINANQLAWALHHQVTRQPAFSLGSSRALAVGVAVNPCVGKAVPAVWGIVRRAKALHLPLRFVVAGAWMGPYKNGPLPFQRELAGLDDSLAERD